ncbi:MAG: 4'-phosphopantetheinyl transferase superfamily protein [Lachnospiraceae bacterium]|nr:4'-phosphopantetheinyl transferase superfamily protein [Lachnospiraceae bacterium]
MEVYLIRTDDKRKEDLSDLLSYVEDDYREKVLRYRFPADRKRSLYGHLLARYAIIKEWGLKNSEIKMLTGPYGKPYLKDREDVFFNVSHSGDLAVCVTGKGPVGIDVQEIKGTKEGLAQRFFSKEENHSLAGLTKEEREKAFFSLWSLKEAYIKAEGKGLSIPLDSFSILLKGSEIKLYIEGEEKEGYSFRQYDGWDGYALSVCAMGDDLPESVRETDIEDIIKMLESCG